MDGMFLPETTDINSQQIGKETTKLGVEDGFKI
jgi:hypothetical protein